MGELYTVRSYLDSDYHDELLATRFSDGDSPLIAALMVGRYPLVEYLLSCGAEPNTHDSNGIPALHGVVATCFEAGLRGMLAYKADPNIRAQRTDSEIGNRLLGLSALHGAILQHWREGIEILLEAGADARALADNDTSVLMLAVMHGAKEDVLEMLLRHGADINAQNEFGQSTLHCAVDGKIGIVKFLLSRGGRVEIRTGRGHSVLHLALLEGRSKVCETLLGVGADINDADDKGRTPLMNVCRQTRISAAEFLLKNRADVARRDRQQRTALHYAAKRGSLMLVRMLIEAGADPFVDDAADMSPLALAEAGGAQEDFAERFREAAVASPTDDCMCMELRRSPLLKCARCTDGHFHWTCMDRWVRGGKPAACWICRNELAEYPKDAHVPKIVQAFLEFLTLSGVITSSDDAEVRMERVDVDLE